MIKEDQQSDFNRAITRLEGQTALDPQPIDNPHELQSGDFKAAVGVLEKRVLGSYPAATEGDNSTNHERSRKRLLPKAVLALGATAALAGVGYLGVKGESPDKAQIRHAEHKLKYRYPKNKEPISLR